LQGKLHIAEKQRTLLKIKPLCLILLCTQPTSEQENSKNNVERRKRASNDALFATGSSNLIQDFPKAFV
jgi:hypothetical protein